MSWPSSNNTSRSHLNNEITLPDNVCRNLGACAENTCTNNLCGNLLDATTFIQSHITPKSYLSLVSVPSNSNLSSSSLNSSDGCLVNIRLSKSHNKQMLSQPLLCDNATYAANGSTGNLLVGPISTITYSIVCPCTLYVVHKCIHNT